MSAWYRILGTAISPFSQEGTNKALHLTAIPLRSIAADELGRFRAKKAWHILPGESPGRVRVSRPPVWGVGSVMAMTCVLAGESLTLERVC